MSALFCVISLMHEWYTNSMKVVWPLQNTLLHTINCITFRQGMFVLGTPTSMSSLHSLVHPNDLRATTIPLPFVWVGILPPGLLATCTALQQIFSSNCLKTIIYFCSRNPRVLKQWRMWSHNQVGWEKGFVWKQHFAHVRERGRLVQVWKYDSNIVQEWHKWLIITGFWDVHAPPCPPPPLHTHAHILWSDIIMFQFLYILFRSFNTETCFVENFWTA